MRGPLFILFAFLIYGTMPMILPPQTDCYNKSFICYDEDRFYQCVDIGNKTVIMGEPQFCPRGLKCYDDDEIECGEPWSEWNFVTSTTIKPSTQTDEFEKSSVYGDILTTNNKPTETVDTSVSVQNSTDRFLIISNQNMTTSNEIILVTEREKFETEFNKSTATTTNSATETPLENNDFVETTHSFSTNEKTDESLLRWTETTWKTETGTESGESKAATTTEVETVASTIKTDAPEDADYDYVYDIWNEDAAETNSSTADYGTFTVNNEKELVSTEMTSNAKQSADQTTLDDITESDISTGNVLSSTDYSQLETFALTTEQNEISTITEKSEVTSLLETNSDDSESSADGDQSTVTQPEISKSITTENKLFSLAADVDHSTLSAYYLDTTLTETFESKEQTTITEGEITEALGFTTSVPTQTAERNTYTTSGEVEGSTLAKTEVMEYKVVTPDATLFGVSQEISEESTMSTESNFTSNSNEQITFTRIESATNSELNSISTETTSEWEIPMDTDELVLTTWSTTNSDLMGNNSKTTQVVWVTETTFEKISTTNKNDGNLTEESTTEGDVRSTDDTIGKQTIKVTSEETSQPLLTLIIESTTFPIETNSAADENNSGEISTESFHLVSEGLSSIQEKLNITDIATSAINFEESTRSSHLHSTTNEEIKTTEERNTESLHFESEGFSSTEENLFGAHISTNATNSEDDTGSSDLHSTTSESLHRENLYDTNISTIAANFEDDTENSDLHSTTSDEQKITNVNELNENMTSLLDFPISSSSLPSPTINKTDNTKSVTDDEEAHKNFTTKDTLTSETAIFSSTTDLILTISNQLIDDINNLQTETTTSELESSRPEVTTEGAVFLTNQTNGPNISMNASNGLEPFYDSEMPIVNLTSTEFISSTESESVEIFSTSNDVSTLDTTTYEATNTVPSNDEVAYTVAPPSSFSCSSVGKFPDPKSCSKFHLCINAFVKYIAIALDCPKGTLFDSTLKECTRRPVQCPGEISLTCTTSGTHPHPTDCSRYYKCLWRSFAKNFSLKQFRCPRGTRYGTKNRRCEPTTATECANSFVPEIDISFKCVEAGRFAVDASCREYYECKEKNGKMSSYRKSCSESKLFDAEWGRCRKSHLVVCPFGDYDSRENSEIDDRSVEYG